MKRRIKKNYETEETEETVQLGDLLEPSREQQWEEYAQEPDFYEEQPFDEAENDPYAGLDEYGEEYSEEHEMADSESRFRIAMGMFDLISIIVGIVVILVLVSMLITLFNWLRNDILHSALLLQSGLQ